MDQIESNQSTNELPYGRTDALSAINGHTLAKNSTINLIGYVLPIFFVLFATPYIVKGFGKERYGLLSLTWMVLGYFSLFDLGLGPAVTKFVAEVIGKESKDEISGIVWTTIFVQGLVGAMAALLLVAIIPFLTNKVFSIPSSLKGEARIAFYIAALYVPVLLTSGSFRGVLAAAQRFDLINIVKVPTQVSTYVAGIIGVYFQWDISVVVAMILCARIILLLVQIKMAITVFSELTRIRISKAIFCKIAVYGGWITLSNSINPVILYVDRFLIGATIGMAALTFYTVPFDLAARLWIISTSMTMTLFPAFSSLTAEGNHAKLRDFYMKSIKMLSLMSGPIVCTMIAFSRDILNLWVGSEFADKSTTVFQVLLVGMLLDYPQIISSTLLEGSGHPRTLAVIKFVYLPIHILLCVLFLRVFNIAGAALSIFVLRLVYSILFSMFSAKVTGAKFAFFVKQLLPSYLIIGGLLFLSFIGLSFDLWSRLIQMPAFLFIYGIIAWKWGLDWAERDFLISMSKTTIASIKLFRLRLSKNKVT